MFTSVANLDYYLENTLHMSIYNLFKTNNPILDTIIGSLVIALFSYMFNKITKLFSNFKDISLDLFFTKNKILLEGKICTSTCTYSEIVAMNSVYSDSFKAINNHIIKSIGKNSTIFHIREIYVPTKDYNGEDENNLFIVDQKQNILIDKKNSIYILTTIRKEEDESDDKKKKSYSIENITIEIYSYKSSLKELNNFIQKITNDYLINIEKTRKTKKYIYKLFRSPNEDINKFHCWMETEFNTTRNFNNLFFDKKKEVLTKIDFFLKNKKWYKKTGMPYTLGIGLHGPPGTGKTSFIKALAKYTNRHIVILSLKLLKKRQYLEEFFFETQYNRLNKNDLTFDKKIIVIEDIDCNDDIVLDRDLKEKKKKKIIENEKRKYSNPSSLVDENFKKLIDDDPITLDDILNLWDGIQETPGRILIISSNHYEKLDPALIRPGRIDIPLQLKNASHEVISDIYNYLFDEKLLKNSFKKIQEYKYSPAQLINFYMQSNNDKKEFLKLIQVN